MWVKWGSTPVILTCVIWLMASISVTRTGFIVARSLSMAWILSHGSAAKNKNVLLARLF
jgi:hypothetical protein